MKVCEQRNLQGANEHDVIEAIFESGELDLVEILNLLGEEFSTWSNSHRDQSMIEIAKKLTPKGRDVIYALANWSIWQQSGEQRKSFDDPQYPMEDWS